MNVPPTDTERPSGIVLENTANPCALLCFLLSQGREETPRGLPRQLPDDLLVAGATRLERRMYHREHREGVPSPPSSGASAWEVLMRTVLPQRQGARLTKPGTKSSFRTPSDVPNRRKEGPSPAMTTKAAEENPGPVGVSNRLSSGLLPATNRSIFLRCGHRTFQHVPASHTVPRPLSGLLRTECWALGPAPALPPLLSSMYSLLQTK